MNFNLDVPVQQTNFNSGVYGKPMIYQLSHMSVSMPFGGYLAVSVANSLTEGRNPYAHSEVNVKSVIRTNNRVSETYIL